MAKWAYLLGGFAALSGAAGVTQAAVAAHLVPDPLLGTSTEFLLFNASAVIAIVAMSLADSQPRASLLVAASTLLGGCLLFCGELTAHALLGRKILPLAAPVGGALMIVGWLIGVLAVFARLFEGERRQ